MNDDARNRRLRNEVAKMRAEGSTTDELLTVLKTQGLSIVAAMKIVMDVLEVPLRDAKQIVVTSGIWESDVAASEPFQQDFLESFEKIDSHDEGGEAGNARGKTSR